MTSESALDHIDPPIPPVLLSIPQTAAALGGLSPEAARRLIAAGEIRATRIGYRVFVRPTDLRAYVDGLAGDQQAS